MNFQFLQDLLNLKVLGDIMATNYPKSGPNDVPQYQMSGVPHITRGTAPLKSSNASDCLRVAFPYVTRDLTIKNTGAVGLRVGFSAGGTINGSTHSIVIGSSQTVSYDFRCKDLFLMSDNGSSTCTFELTAGLTTIRADQFPVLTSSLGGTLAFEGIG